MEIRQWSSSTTLFTACPSIETLTLDLQADPVLAARRASVGSSIPVLTALCCSTNEGPGAVGRWPTWI